MNSKLNESKKEVLPIDFITQFVSKGWSEVGDLKASIDAITQEFSGTGKVEAVLQDLIDSYLIAIGQMELYLDKKNYLDMPDEEKLTEKLVLSEDLSAEEEVSEKEKQPELEQKPQPPVDKQLPPQGQRPEAPKEAPKVPEQKPIDKPEKKEEELFEFFTDFEEPEPDEEANSSIKAWLNK